MTDRELAESIARWVGQNAEKDSAMLYPAEFRSWTVNATSLLDHIAEVTGIEKEQLGEWAT
jgi:hypothetical protein